MGCILVLSTRVPSGRMLELVSDPRLEPADIPDVPPVLTLRPLFCEATPAFPVRPEPPLTGADSRDGEKEFPKLVKGDDGERNEPKVSELEDGDDPKALLLLPNGDWKLNWPSVGNN